LGKAVQVSTSPWQPCAAGRGKQSTPNETAMEGMRIGTQACSGHPQNTAPGWCGLSKGRAGWSLPNQIGGKGVEGVGQPRLVEVRWEGEQALQAKRGITGRAGESGQVWPARSKRDVCTCSLIQPALPVKQSCCAHVATWLPLASLPSGVPCYQLSLPLPLPHTQPYSPPLTLQQSTSSPRSLTHLMVGRPGAEGTPTTR